MKLCCPECGHASGLSAFVNEAQAREFVRLALSWPAPMADLLVAYLQLFRPPKRALRWERATVLLESLIAAMERSTVKRHGREWAAPRPAWEPAIRTVLAKRDELTLPLRDHSYLFEILARQANKAEASAENKTEAARRNRGGPDRSGGKRLSDMVQAERERLRQKDVNEA